MNRRTALQHLGVLLGGVTLTPDLMANTIARATSGEIPAGINPQNLTLLAELVNTIIPDTDTPGAKAAGVHNFIALVLEDCVAPKEKEAFWSALEKADAACRAAHGKSFVDCTEQQRAKFLTDLSANSAQSADPSFWPTLQGMTTFGYFTSEIGMTQALAYDPIPGGWVPDLKIDSNTKAWATMF
jgi:hypothetical protein